MSIDQKFGDGIEDADAQPTDPSYDPKDQDKFHDTLTPPVNDQDVPDASNVQAGSAEQDRVVNRERADQVDG